MINEGVRSRAVAIVRLPILASSCGGGGSDGGEGTGGGTPTPVSYTVTENAGSSGSISPGSAVVTSGNTASFTLSPVGGYRIASASGWLGNPSRLEWARMQPDPFRNISCLWRT